MRRQLRLVLAVAAVATVTATPSNGEVERLRAAMPHTSWRRLVDLQRLVEKHQHHYTVDDFLRETGTLDLYRALPGGERPQPPLPPADILRLLIALTIGPYITPMLAAGISPTCRNNSWAYVTGLLSDNSNSKWALLMFDADGKLPDGMLAGNLNPVGCWHECLSVEATVTNINGLVPLAEGRFRGKHCQPRFSLARNDSKGEQSAAGLAANRLAGFGLEPILPPIFELSGQVMLFPLSASIGLCIPSTCSAQDLRLSLQNKMSDLTVELDESNCDVKGKKRNYSAGDIVMLTILSITGLLMVVGTFIDVIKNISKNEDADLSISVDRMFRGRMPLTLQKVLLAFSVWTNGRKILDTSLSSDTLACLHGLRFLSMTWVILGHQYIFGLSSVPWTNLFYVFDILNSLAFAAVYNASVSVDSFFFLSGLLVAYIFMRNMDKSKGKFNIVMYYVHRYIRITPVLAMVIGFVGSVYVHLGDGPFWGRHTEHSGSHYMCRKYWWKNLLYINNIYDSHNACLGQAWYLANDMQMFVASPIVLLPLYFYPTLGQIWVMFLIALNVFITGYVTDYNDLGPSGGDASVRYFVPWCRYGAYLVGVYTGWFLHQRKGKSLRISLPVVLAGWVTSAFVACLIIYGLYDYTTIPPQAVVSSSVSILYAALNRPVWAVCLAWVVIACVHGYGGFINTLLSWKFWIPLSRITYCAYLVSIDVQVWYYSTLKSVLYFDQTTAVYQYLATLMVSLVIAAMFSLAFEAPVLALEKIIFANIGAVAPKPDNGKLPEREIYSPEQQAD